MDADRQMKGGTDSAAHTPPCIMQISIKSDSTFEERRRLNPFSLFAISRLFARLTPLRETRYVSADVLDISFLRLRAPSEGTDSVYLRDTHEHALAMGIQAMSYALAESWTAGWRSLSLSL